MKPVVVTLPDGAKKECPAGTTPKDIAQKISSRLEEACIAAKVGEKVVDLSTVISEDCHLVLLKKETPEGLEVIRHSTAHLLAHAIKELYPKTQITIGPVTEDGFYYDIDPVSPLTVEDLPKIEKKMGEIAGRKLEVTRIELSKDEAIQFFEKQGEYFKVEIIRDIPDAIVSLYQQGDFTDLCRGPHVPNTARLGKFKLLSISGAYWRGSEKNKMLQRIYGTAFATQKELDEHIHNLDEAKKRDHRKLGPEMELFTFLTVAPAMPFFLPKGTTLFNLMGNYIRSEIQEIGYQEVICPQLMNAELWKTSGHLDFYKDNMFSIERDDGLHACLKPMNCPGHAVLFGSTKHSYRELPVRFAEFTKLHRYERAGVTHGLFRTRAFAQDDAHIFCTEEQIEQESLNLIQLTQKVYNHFGFNEMVVMLATRPEKFMGTVENFDKATQALKSSLEKANVPYKLAEGEGAFYGPKIEFHIRDNLKRLWQCGTIQVDFSTPRQFELEYIDSEGKPQVPVMVHRAIFGSFERFLGILIEHHGGHFPFWIAPVQASIINVTPEQQGYAKEIFDELSRLGLRLELNLKQETLGYKIREAQMKKVPIMIILGHQEAEKKTVSIRKHTGENLNHMTLDNFKAWVNPLLKPGGSNY